MSVLTATSEGVVYYVRVLPATTTYTEAGAVTWASSPRGLLLLLAVQSPVANTPGWLRVSVSNGPPLATADFWIDGGAVAYTTDLDENGQAVGSSVPLPALAAGSHVLSVATPTASTTATFEVTNEPLVYPTPVAADSGPIPVAQTGVVRWVLQDLVESTDFIFPINPSKMSAPHAARVFTTEHSTAPDGQSLTFEGAPVGVDWTIEGTCLTQGFHDALDGFLALPRRVYLIDHLSRAWVVSLESINWSRLAAAYNDWAHTYVIKAIIYSGPEQT